MQVCTIYTFEVELYTKPSIIKVLEIYLSFLILCTCSVMLLFAKGYNKVLYHASSTSYIMHAKQLSDGANALGRRRVLI